MPNENSFKNLRRANKLLADWKKLLGADVLALTPLLVQTVLVQGAVGTVVEVRVMMVLILQGQVLLDLGDWVVGTMGTSLLILVRTR